MSNVPDIFDSLSRNIISLLRYVFPPIVGFLVAFVGYGYDLDGMEKYYLKLNGIHVFLMFLIIFGLGLTIYHFHRAVIHHFPSTLMILFFRRKIYKGFRKPTICQLNFARWIRRGSAVTIDAQVDQKVKNAQSIQKALDMANAGTHFLYCSGLSALMWFYIFGLYKGDLTHPIFFKIVTIVLFAAAILSEFWTTFYDLKAYKKYKEKKGREKVK